MPRDHFTIGELAGRAGVTPDTLRYYERLGLLPAPARSNGGYRLYDASAEDRVAFIRKAQALGLSLAEVREVLRIAAAGTPPCAHVRAAPGRCARAGRGRSRARACARSSRPRSCPGRRRSAPGRHAASGPMPCQLTRRNHEADTNTRVLAVPELLGLSDRRGVRRRHGDDRGGAEPRDAATPRMERARARDRARRARRAPVSRRRVGRSAVVLLAGLAVAPAPVRAPDGGPQRVTVTVTGLSCPFCAYGLEKRLRRLEGLDSLHIEFQSGQVVLYLRDGSKVGDQELRRVVQDAGFEARKIERAPLPPAS